MSQESDKQMKQPEPEDPTSRPPLYRPPANVVGGPPRQHSSSQPGRVSPPEQEERMRRLRELRQQRQQSGYNTTPPHVFQRRGLPTPPPVQPTFQDTIKHWWRNGPFASPLPLSEENERINKPGPVTTRPSTSPSGPPSPLEQRARAWLAQSRRGLARCSIQVRDALLQIIRRFKQRAISTQKSGEAAEIVPGLIVVGFAPGVSRQDAVKQIDTLGGKPLRYRTATNSYQVAVPPGQEEVLIHHFRQLPGVILSDLERSPG